MMRESFPDFAPAEAIDAGPVSTSGPPAAVDLSHAL